MKRQQLLADLKTVLAEDKPLNPTEQLRCDLTRLIDESPCSYEIAIRLLNDQIKWLEKARKDEHGR